MTSQKKTPSKIPCKPVGDNVVVKLVDRVSELETDSGVKLPRDFMVNKHPNKPYYGAIVDWGDLDADAYEKVHKDNPRKSSKQTARVKRQLDDIIDEPYQYVAAFSRGRQKPFLDENGEEFNFVKIANLLWIEEYDTDTFEVLENK